MQPCAEGRRNLKLATIVGREASHLAFNRKETQDASRIARVIGCNRPADDDLVADIGMHRAAMVADRFVDIEKETRDEVVHPKLAHCFGKARRVGDVEKHHDQLLADRTMVGPRTTLVRSAPPISRRVSVTMPTTRENPKPIRTTLGRVTVSQSGVSQSR